LYVNYTFNLIYLLEYIEILRHNGHYILLTNKQTKNPKLNMFKTKEIYLGR